MKFKRVNLKASLLAGAVAMAFSGCAVLPQPITAEERQQKVEEDLEKMFAEQEPLQHSLGLEEAMARALKHNLENRLRMMEEALAFGQTELASYDMLPKLTAAAGYIARNNELVSDSIDVNTRKTILGNSTSLDKTHHTADLSLTWNLLDFGVSYFQAHQQADRALIMRERRRKTVHTLMQQVRQAYWQAVGAQALEGQVAPLLAQVNQALFDAELVEKEKLRPPLEILNYRKSLLDLVRQLEAIRDELAQAKPRLASLINLPPGTKFDLMVPDNLEIPTLNASLPDYENAALMQRPDLIEVDLQERISVNEVKKSIARMFPGIEFNVGPHYDSNSFLHNNRWIEGGTRISWNLFSLLSAPKQKEIAEKQLDITKAQRLALNMAVLTQVHVAYRDFTGRLRQYELSKQLLDLDQKIHEQTNTGAKNDSQSRLNAIRSGTGELMANYRRYQSYAGLQAAYSQMLATVGIDPLPERVDAHDIPTISKAINLHMKDMMNSIAGSARRQDTKE